MDYELENVVNQRKEVEKAIIKKLVNKNSKYKIYSLFCLVDKKNFLT